MKSRAILLYWLLLLAPTLGAGVFMLRLLRHEGERLAMAETAAVQNRARVMADEIALLVDDTRDGLMETLRALPPAKIADSLRAWEDANPLVRNVFVWDDTARRLVLPDADTGVTSEQTGFIRRYGELFSGRSLWPTQPPAEDRQIAQSPRQQIRLLTKNSQPQADMTQSEAAPAQGWLTWFWEDQLHLLGWQRTADGRSVCGVEIEMEALLSRIAAGFAEKPAADLVYALLDANGRVFVQRGSREIASNEMARAAVPVGPQLPHWQVAVYGPAPRAAAGGFAAVSALLVGVFVVAILSGGSLLMWQARRNLREAQQRTSFVSHVSHELKTPLTTIRMYAEMLAEGRVSAEEKRRTYLETITRESQRLTRLVNNVLDFSRLEQGRKKYQAERLDVVAAVREVLDSQADRLREAGLELAEELPEEPAFARLDRDAFSQCLLNLVDNAIKYAATGGKLVVRLARSGGTPAADAWTLAVEDAGPGIPAAHRAKLFEQFQRADESLTAKVAGFGLGLSISRRLLRDQGGELTFEPSAGGGARFVMQLPGDAT